MKNKLPRYVIVQQDERFNSRIEGITVHGVILRAYGNRLKAEFRYTQFILGDLKKHYMLLDTSTAPYTVLARTDKDTPTGGMQKGKWCSAMPCSPNQIKRNNEN